MCQMICGCLLWTGENLGLATVTFEGLRKHRLEIVCLIQLLFTIIAVTAILELIVVLVCLVRLPRLGRMS